MSKKERKRSKDTIRSLSPNSPVKEQRKTKAEEVLDTAPEFDESYNDQIKEYNKRISDLDPMYANLQPLSEVLLRVYCREMTKDENGMLLPNQTNVMVRTNSGYGIVGTMDNPFPYTRKAIVVASPKSLQDDESYNTLKPGDVVVLKNSPIAAVAQGSGDNAQINIPHLFLHPDYHEEKPPSDPSNRHFGYLLMPSHDIKIKM